MYVMLRTMQAGLAHEARRLRRIENKGYSCTAQQDYDNMKQQELMAKYGKLTVVQWHRIMTRYRRSLKPAQAVAVGRAYTTRTQTLRRQARAVTLVRAFFKGHPYDKVEAFAYTAPPWKEISAMVQDYHPENRDIRDVMQSFSEWFHTAKESYRIHHQSRLDADPSWIEKQKRIAAEDAAAQQSAVAK